MSNEITVTTSKKFRLNWQDYAKGIVVAILTPVIFIIQNSLDAGTLSFNWKQISIAAISGFVAYLVKNFFTSSQTIVRGLSEEDGVDNGLIGGRPDDRKPQ